MSLQSFETGNLSADNFKKILDLDGSTLELAVLSGDTGQRMPCFDSCQLIIDVQLVFSWAPKLAKCVRVNINCGADGRSAVGGRRSVYGHVITKFCGMGRFT